MIVPLADLKLWLNEPATDTASDPLLTSLESAAARVVQDAIGRHFDEEESVTVYLAGPGDTIYLRDEPAATPALVVSERASLSSAWVDLAEGDAFERDGRALRRIDGLEWPDGQALVRASYVRGYEEGEAPADVRELVCELVGYLWRTGRKADASGLSLGELEAKLPSWRHVMARHRRFACA